MTGQTLTIKVVFGTEDRARLEDLTVRLRQKRPEDTVLLGLSLLDALADLIEANDGHVDVHDDRPLDEGKPERILRLDIYPPRGGRPGLPEAA